MLVAVFSAGDPRAGHKVLYENGAFKSDTGEPLGLDQMMELDRRNQVTWVNEQIRNWAHEFEAIAVPPTGMSEEVPEHADARPADLVRYLQANWKGLFTPTGLVLVLILFALPFLEVSCAGQRMLTISGYQLVTGFAATGSQHFGPQWLVIAALVLALAGIAVSFLRLPAKRLLLSICSAAGAGLLIAFVVKVANDIQDTTTPLVSITVTFGLGLVGAVAVFIAIAAVNVALYAGVFWRSTPSPRRPEVRRAIPAPPLQPPPVPG